MSEAVKLPPCPAIPTGAIVWCRAARSYDQRRLTGWSWNSFMYCWEASVIGRHVRIPQKHVFTSRADCHRSLLVDMEAAYERSLNHCRRLKQQLDGVRNTVNDDMGDFKLKVEAGK